MRLRRKYLFTLALPLAVAAAALAWATDLGRKPVALPSLLSMQGWASTKPTLTYDTAPLAKGSIRKIVSTSGPVRALVTVSVGTQLSGQLQELKVDFNSEVKADEVLAVIDDKTFAARVASAKADLAMAEAQLVNNEASLRKAEAVQKQAERVGGRQQALAQKGIAAQASVDNAVRDLDVAKADIAVAKAQIENGKALIAQRKAGLEQTQIDFDRTRIRSPINGTVIGRTVDVGQTVAASLASPELFKIAQDLRRIRLEAQVNEADVGSVADGNTVAFTVDAYPERKFEGVVTQVRLAATELQNIVTYTVIIEAANDDRRLFPGMTANVQIETAKRDNALRIPNDALRFKPREGMVTTPAAAAAGGAPAQRSERQARFMEQLKDELQLSDEQQQTLRAEMAKFFADLRGQGGGAGSGGGGGGRGAGAGPGMPGFGAAVPSGTQDPAAGFRQRMLVHLEGVLLPLLTEAQRPLFDRWKRGRENTRAGTVVVLSAAGEPEQRQVRLGIADDQFTELIGGQLKEGERLVLRAREVKK